jgi:hypothetical protein
MRKGPAPRTQPPSGEDGPADRVAPPPRDSESVPTSAAKGDGPRRKTSRYISKHHAANQTEALDPRLIFLERAAARLILVEAGLLELDEAFHGLLASLGLRKPKQKRSAT